MKTSSWFLTGLLLCGGGAAIAATPREALQKQVAKVAPPVDARPKALCACSAETSSPTFANRVGTIRQLLVNNQVHVTCRGDTFNAAGDAIGSFACSIFYPLVK